MAQDVLVMTDHDSVLSQSLLHFYEEERFFDFWIASGDTRIGAHKLILSATSDFFSALFESSMAECSNSEVRLVDIDSNTLRIVLNFIYKGELVISMATAPDLLHAFSFLQISLGFELIKTYLKSKLDKTTSLPILSLSHLYDLGDVKLEAMSLVLDSFMDIGKSDQVFDFSRDLLVEVISNPKLICASEFELFCICGRWLKHHACDSDTFFQVLKHVKFPLMSTEEIIKSVNAETYMQEEPCLSLLQEAKNFHLYRNVPKLLTTIDNIRCKVRSQESIVAIGSFSMGQKQDFFLFHPLVCEWKKVQLPNQFTLQQNRDPTLRSPLIAVYKNYAYIYFSRDGFYIFDPRFLEVRKLTAPSCFLISLASESPTDSKKIYGISNTEQGLQLAIYDPEVDTWNLLPLPKPNLPPHEAPLTATISDVHICAVGYYLYILVDRSLICFNTSTEEFRSLSQYLANNKTTLFLSGMVSFQEKIFVFASECVEHHLTRTVAYCYCIDTNQWVDITLTVKFCLKNQKLSNSVICLMRSRGEIYFLNNQSRPHGFGSSIPPISNCVHKLDLHSLCRSSLSQNPVCATPVFCKCSGGGCGPTSWTGCLAPLAFQPSTLLDCD